MQKIKQHQNILDWWKTIKTIEFGNILRLAAQLGIGLGSAILFLYCIKIRYLPSGLSFGDGLLFIWIAILYGLLNLIVCLSIFFTANLILECLQILVILCPLFCIKLKLEIFKKKLALASIIAIIIGLNTNFS